MPRPCPPCTMPAGHESGTRRAYRYGCRCADSRKADSDYRRARTRMKAYGRLETDPRVDPAPTVKRLQELVDQGHVLEQVAIAVDLDVSVARKILKGTRKQVAKSTETKVLNYVPTHLTKAKGGHAPAIGTARRLQALACVGWGPKALSRASGLHQATLCGVRNNPEREITTEKVAEAVARVYEELWNKEPETHTPAHRAAVTRVQAYAAENGWVPPLAWDEGAIDDPDATPAAEWERTRERMAGARLDNLIELLDAGYEIGDDLYARAGYNSRDSAMKALNRHGRSISEWSTPAPGRSITRLPERTYGDPQVEKLVKLLDSGWSLRAACPQAGYNSRSTATRALLKEGREPSEWQTPIDSAA